MSAERKRGCSPDIKTEVGSPHGAQIAEAVTDILPFASAVPRLETEREQRDAAPAVRVRERREWCGEQRCGLERTHDVLEER